MIPISYPSPRVSQLDANILDSELISLLKEQLTSIFQLHSTSWWTYDQHPELWSLLLNLMVFRLTVWRSGSSYGALLQNLKLTDFKKGKLIGYSKRTLLCAVLVGDYFYSKLQSYLYSIDESEASRNASNFKLLNSIKSFFITHKTKILLGLNDCFKLLNLVNFTLFLVNGRYPSISHRLFGISLTPIVTDLLKFNGNKVNFEFQNRQLVWNVMTEFLVFILPLMQLGKLKRMTKKILSPYKKGQRRETGDIPIFTLYTNLPVSQCAICHNNNDIAATSSNKNSSISSSCMVTNPYVTNCGHIYCYICIATKFNSLENTDSDSEGCLRCGMKLQWFKEVGDNEGDIDEEAIIVLYEDMEENGSDEDEETAEQELVEKNIFDIEQEEDDQVDEKGEPSHSRIESDEEGDINENSDYSEGEDFDEDEDLEQDIYDDDFDSDFDEGLDL